MSSLLHPFTELADATLTNCPNLHRAVMQIEFLAVLWWQVPGAETIILLLHTLTGGGGGMFCRAVSRSPLQ